VTFSNNFPAGAATGDSFPSGVSVFDHNGVSKQINLAITKQAALNTWQATSTTPDGTITAVVHSQSLLTPVAT
jgi:hypothetical protein